MSRMTLELKNGIKFYVSGREITRALSDINVSFQTGEFVAITGESGSGKSTLVHILAGVLPADKGTFYINGVSTLPFGEAEWEDYRRDTISFIAQNYGILPGSTVWDNVVSALLLAGLTKEQAADRAEKLLRQVELWTYKNRRAAKLSSGQKQRLSIARAVAKPAPVLIADEPTSNLDAGNSERIIALFKEEAKSRLVIMVTHDFESVKNHVTRHVELKNGILMADEVLGEKLQEFQEKKEQQEAAEHLSDGNLRKKKSGSALGCYIGQRMIKARPVWAALVLLLFSLTAFATFAFLGTFFSALDDSAAKYYTADAFYNGNSRRLAVVRQDGSPMTEEDYKTLLSVSYIEAVEPYGVLSDVNYYYRKNIDYTVDITRGNGNGSDEYRETILMENDTLFLQTLPYLKSGEEFLTEGRLPKHPGEVVISGGEEWLGKQFKVYISDRKQWSARTYLTEEVTVVGLTDRGENLYVYGTSELVQSIHPELSVEETKSQAAVFLKDYSYTNRAVKKLSKLGYEAISPYQMGTIVEDSELSGQRMMTLVLCILALLLVFAMELIVLGVLFGTQLADYKQLRTLGLTYRTGKQSVNYQVAFFTATGWLICGLFVVVCAVTKLSLLQNILNYLEAWQVVFFALVHGLASMLVAAIVKKNLRSNIFRFLPTGLDPELSELEAGEKEKNI